MKVFSQMFAVSVCAANSTTTRASASIPYAVFQAVVINKLIYAMLGMVSPAQQIVDDWTLFFDGQLGSAIVMLSLRHLTVYVKQPMNSSSLK